MKAVFLDRDGVINVNRRDHVKSWEEFQFLPGSLNSVSILTRTGLPIFVITNQAIINRRIVSRAAVDEIHQRMCQEVARHGGQIQGVIYCPHKPEELCDCRKPRTGLLHRTAQDFGLDLEQSYVVGDALSDIAAGLSAGCQSVLVLSGRGWRQLLSRGALSYRGYHIALDLSAAVKWIVRREGFTKFLL